MADNSISANSAALNERLLTESERGELQETRALSGTRKKLLLVVLAAVGVACLVVGVVAATGSFNKHSSSPSSSSSGSSFSVVSQKVLQNRPKFSAPVGSLAHAPEPRVIESDNETETAILNFEHSNITEDGQISHTHLHYQVVKKRNVHCPAQHESVLAIDCLPTRIRISFSNASKALSYAAQWTSDTILFLRQEWGCGAHVRQFVGEPQVDGRFLFVETVNTSIGSAFQHANVSFFTNHSNPNGPTLLQTTANNPPLVLDESNEGGDRRRHFSLHNAIHNAVHAVTSAAHKLVDAAVGDVSLSVTPFSAHYTVPPTTLTEGDANTGVSMTYSGDISVGTHVQLKIHNYHVDTFSASIDGSIEATASAHAQATFDYSKSQAKPITSNIQVASGVVPIFGVPIPLSLFIQVYAGYTVDVKAHGALSGVATVTGQASAGVALDGAGKLEPTGSSSYTHTLKFDKPTVSIQTDVSVHLSPALYLGVGYIGGPIATFTTYAGASLPDESCVVSEVVGAQVDVGAEIHIDVLGLVKFDKEIPSVTVFGPKDLWSGSEDVCNI